MKKIFVMAMTMAMLVACADKQKKDKYDEALDLYEATVIKAADALKQQQNPPEILEAFQKMVPTLEELDSLGTDAQKARMHEIAEKLRYAVRTGGELPAEGAVPEISVSLDPPVQPISIPVDTVQ